MIWIIIVAAIVVLAAVLWSLKRKKVLESKVELERTIESVLDSFGSLRGKITESDLRQNEKDILLANVQRNIDQLERWKNTALPNITFWKNHTEPIEKEFKSLQESVAHELAGYKDLPNPLE
jgi:type II secretory pathway pseudopilin PulG